MSLNKCFVGTPNRPARTPNRREVLDQPKGSGFESRAFAALFAQRERLGIKRLWRCTAARVDGLIETVKGEEILVEIKQTLSWGSVSSAVFEMLAGRELLSVEARSGILVFERVAAEWDRIRPNGGWGQLALHAKEIASHIELGALHVTRQGKITTPRHLLRRR